MSKGSSMMQQGQQGMQGGPMMQQSSQSSADKTQILKELQKSKEVAIKSGNMEEAKKLHAEIENIRAGKSDFTESSGGDGSTQTKESLDRQGNNP